MIGKVKVNYVSGLANRGNWNRLKSVMKRAKAGEPMTLGFIGGSITQGSLSSLPSTCYAYLVYEWWKQRFPATTIAYINAGIGGTTSQFGVARVSEDLLVHRPDFVIVEFSVNDEGTPFYQETYEGLIRTIYKSMWKPAIILLHNIYYRTGDTAQEQHEAVGKHYDLPSLSMRDSVYASMVKGEIIQDDITPDGLHPNDAGHELLAGLVINFLERVYVSLGEEEKPSYFGKELPTPMTEDAYENSMRYRNGNCNPVCKGFVKDQLPQNHITEIFRNGWIGEKTGDSIFFEVSGSCVAVQYRKSVKHPACSAVAIVDGDTEHPFLLDGNFEETWGDCLYLQNLIVHGRNGIHHIAITIQDGKEGEAVPFYLVSVIASKPVSPTVLF